MDNAIKIRKVHVSEHSDDDIDLDLSDDLWQEYVREIDERNAARKKAANNNDVDVKVVKSAGKEEQEKTGYSSTALIDSDAKLVSWAAKDFSLCKHLFLTIDHKQNVYSMALKDLISRNSLWSNLQFWVSFWATVIAFLSVSPATGYAVYMGFSPDIMKDILGVSVGILSLTLTVINDQIKKRKYNVKISECNHIRTEYENMRIRLQSELRYPKTNAIKLDAQMSRLLQDINIKHEIQVPESIVKECKKEFDAAIQYARETGQVSDALGRGSIQELFRADEFKLHAASKKKIISKIRLKKKRERQRAKAEQEEERRRQKENVLKQQKPQQKERELMEAQISSGASQIAVADDPIV